MSSKPEPLLPLAANPAGWARPPKQRAVLVQHSDGTWHGAQVLGWLHDPARGWFVRVRWHDGQVDWRFFDREHMRPP